MFQSERFKLNSLAAAMAGLVILTGCTIHPDRLSDEVRYHHARHDLSNILSTQVPVTGLITMDEAVARTLKYNLDHRIQLAQLALASGQLVSAQYKLLPKLTAKSAYAWRNEFDRTFLAGDDAEPLPPSTSSITPRESLATDIKLTWNLLDFGLSYVRARTQADQVLIAEEQKRKVMHQIVQQARMAYWKAYNAQKLLRDVEQLRGQVNTAIARARQAEAKRVGSAESQLSYQDSLIGSMQQLNGMRSQMYKARQDISKLMSLPPGSNFVLAEPQVDVNSLPRVKVSLEQMDAVALVNRPELRESDYKVRMAQFGITTAVLNSLPGLSFDFAYNHTTNKYKVHPEWTSLNGNVTWDILNLATAQNAIDVAKTQVQLDTLKRMAMTMTVLTQVRMSYIDYEQLREDYFLVDRKNEIAQTLYQYTVRRKQANASNFQAVVQKKIAALNAEMNRNLTYARAQDALANLYSSVGVNLMPTDDLEMLSLEALTRLVSKQMYYYHVPDQFNRMVVHSYNTILNDVNMSADGTPKEVSPFNCQRYAGRWSCAVKPHDEYQRDLSSAKEQAELVQSLVQDAESLDMVKTTEENMEKKHPFDCDKVNGQWSCSLNKS